MGGIRGWIWSWHLWTLHQWIWWCLWGLLYRVCHPNCPRCPCGPKGYQGYSGAGYTTVKSDCREVTKEVCVNTPKKTTKTVPVTNCNSKQTVSCHKVTKKIPKKNCETVEAKITVPVAEVSHGVVSSCHIW